jgi:hypothetical protein
MRWTPAAMAGFEQVGGACDPQGVGGGHFFGAQGAVLRQRGQHMDYVCGGRIADGLSQSGRIERVGDDHPRSQAFQQRLVLWRAGHADDLMAAPDQLAHER